MQTEILRVSQYVLKHPILNERENYKKKYLNTLEYFVRKYSNDNPYSVKLLEIYKNKLLSNPEKYDYEDEELRKISKGVMAWKMKRFKFFSYRYCLLVDVIFVCSFLEFEKSRNIYDEILQIYNKRYWKKLELLFNYIVGDTEECADLDKIDYLVRCIENNRIYLQEKERSILVTANMSAGKSTLLNALIGKKVNRTQNEACTAKIHWLLNKAFEDTLSYEYDFELELDASYDVLMNDNKKNRQKEIYVATKFRSINNVDIPIHYIDTPGVNSSQNELHKSVSEKAILKLKYDVMMYVMNAENIGTDDDRKHLEYVAENFKGKVIFVVNKIDRFREEDSVEETLNQVKNELVDIGFEQPLVCPISAYAAYLAKMNMFGEEINEDEKDELEMFYRKMNKEKYRLNNYFPKEYQSINVSEDKNEQLLLHSGILSLERILYERGK